MDCSIVESSLGSDVYDVCEDFSSEENLLRDKIDSVANPIFKQLVANRVPRQLNKSVGGHASGKTKEDGSSEASGEIHIISKSDDGKTSFEISGEGKIDNQGNKSAGVKASFEHEF
jgi:hypothetical protein